MKNYNILIKGIGVLLLNFAVLQFAQAATVNVNSPTGVVGTFDESSLTDTNASITANIDSIATNTASITANADAIATNAGSITANADAITTNAGSITANANAITTNAASITANANNIANNAASITINANNIARNTASITAVMTDVNTGQVNVRTANIGDGGLTVSGASTFTGAVRMRAGLTVDGVITGNNGLNVRAGSSTLSVTDSAIRVDGGPSRAGLTIGNNIVMRSGVNTSKFSIESRTGREVFAVDVNTGDITMSSGAQIKNNANGAVELVSSNNAAKLIIDDNKASIGYTNTQGNFHGITVGADKTTLTGGSRSSSMVLDDDGVKFSNSSTGAPIRVTGVADGSKPYDAVNVRQLRIVQRGIASSMAMDAIPTTILKDGSRLTFGMGVATFSGANAIAAGVTYHDKEAGMILGLKGSTSRSHSDNEEHFSLGMGWSF